MKKSDNEFLSLQNPDFTFKKWEDLDITDDFIFSQVMQDETLCRPLVEKILGIRIGKIKYLNDQQEEKIAPGSHGIRMDIYLKDEDKIINVEMQTRNYNDLPQRARFYQSVGDVNSLAPGELYGELMDHYVIFICTFDLFKQDMPKYTFYYTCQESKDLLLNDGSCIIFMNTSVSEKSAQNLDSDIKSFYDYIEKRGNAERLAGKFDSAIAQLKENDDKRRYYMTYTSRIMEAKIDGQKLGEKIGETRGIKIGETRGIDIGRTQGIEIGETRGRTQGIISTAKNLLKMGLSVADIAKATGLSDQQIMNAVNGTDDSKK